MFRTSYRAFYVGRLKDYWISEYIRQHNPDNLMSYFEETNTGEMFLQFAVSEGKIVWYAIGTVQL